MSDAAPQIINDITDFDIRQVTGWIGRHALPATLPDGMPEYRTGLALDAVVTETASHLRARLPLGADQECRESVRNDWNLLVTAAQTWSDEPDYPGWQTIRD